MMKISRTGQIQLLTDLLGGGTLHAWNFRLSKTNITPAVTDTLSTYSTAEATFTGYTAGGVTLTRAVGASTWNTPAGTGTSIDAGGNAKSTYGSAAQSWSATSAQTIYGYYIVDPTASVLICGEAFASSISLVNPSTLNITPAFEFGST